jgi:hypothetical protein
MADLPAVLRQRQLVQQTATADPAALERLLVRPGKADRRTSAGI